MSMEEPGKLQRALIDTTAGALAGAISRTVTSPLDVIKIRFQVMFLFCGSILCAYSDFFGHNQRFFLKLCSCISFFHLLECIVLTVFFLI